MTSIILVSRNGENNLGNAALTSILKRHITNVMSRNVSFQQIDRMDAMEKVCCDILYSIVSQRKSSDLDENVRSKQCLEEMECEAKRIVQSPKGSPWVRVLVFLCCLSPRLGAALVRIGRTRGVLGEGQCAAAFARQLLSRRVEKLKGAGRVIINPAGEFHRIARYEILPYVFDALLAKCMGAQCYFVNFSFEVEAPEFVGLSIEIFRRCDMICVRDKFSRSRLSQHGLPSTVVPDCVVLAERTADGAVFGAKKSSPARGQLAYIAVSMPALVAEGLYSKLMCLVGVLRKGGFECVLVSNEWDTDKKYLRGLDGESGVSLLGKIGDLDDYLAQLGKCDVLIASRMHTCVLGIVSGVPVIGLENGTSKVSGLMDELGLDPPLQLADDGFESSLVERLSLVASDKSEVMSRQSIALDHARDRCREFVERMCT